jgi:pyruvate,water dikinase
MKDYFILTATDPPDPQLAGGKAGVLMKLCKPFAVPEFIVITPFAFSGTQLKPQAKEALDKEIKKRGDGLFAVRSSAIDEDGAGASFAGQLKSFLNVKPTDIARHAEAVAASAQEAHVAAYRQKQGLAQTSGTAVLVQRMVAADIAGVAFSADPVTARRDRVIINAIAGLADRLVSGEVSGEAYCLTHAGCMVYGPEKGLLNTAQLVELVALAKAVEIAQGSPQDIEWAIAGGKLYLLQVRPITTLPEISGFNVFDNSNIVESYSGVTSPMTFSFAQYVYREVYLAFMALMGVPASRLRACHDVFGNLLTHIQGHVYYNLLNWYRALALFPGFRLNTRYMEQMMGVGESLPLDILAHVVPPAPKGIEKILAMASLARVSLRLVFHALLLPHTRDNFYRRLNTALSEPVAHMQKLSLPELAGRYRALEKQLLSRWDAPLINDFICMIAFGASRRLLQKFLGEEKGARLHADALIGQGDIISAEPAQRVRAMADLLRMQPALLKRIAKEGLPALRENTQLSEAFDAYLEKFGDRCAQELKLESLTLEDDPQSLIASIVALARKPEQVIARRDNPMNAVKKKLAGQPLKYRAAYILLSWAKARVRDRENLRFERTRVFGRVRKILLAIGVRLAEKNSLSEKRDIFYLTIDEALALAESKMEAGNISALVTLRKQHAQEWSAQPSLPNRIFGYGAAEQLVKEFSPEPADSSIKDMALARKGLGCCAGVVQGKVRVIHDPRRENLLAGEIMVARHTDPGWIAVFTGAVGIVVERGSLLSHSAIVARELGIPAIVNLAEATTWLKTGDMIEMDGANGDVRKL